ncbi:XrtA-associated tyrosine autokinase [Niveibacterium terrae]|uniref:XrtA-associated tyrosine autokinase n=1 Tax=Niveibacterium terrae TaxID=3373598 RepID=UPI003A9544D0
MSLIEKAVQRLDQLKQAGVLTAEEGAATVAPEAPAPIAKPSEVPAARARFDVEIDLARLAAKGLVSPEEPNSQIAEQYRIIKRPLLRNAEGRGAVPIRNGNLIMVTSSAPGEGKSFSAINLAVSIAMELDHTVLLVDADISKPSVLNTLGLPPSRGLMDLLLGQENSLGDVLLRTNIDKLSILPAGARHQRSTEFLSSEGMNRLLDEIASRYADRIVIFDSPPLLVTTEARALATHMGQLVMVVEAERTTRSMLKQALATVDNCPVKLMLLNKVRHPGRTGHYGVYGYGYGYGQRGTESA